jgi:XTP/dITP diphosphohydrolase
VKEEKKDRISMVLATKNRGKLSEFHDIFDDVGLTETVSLHSLLEFTDVSFTISEDGVTFAENALIKARAAAAATGRVSLADDSGICVDALGGRPGVWSSRYAGASATDEENNEKLLRELSGVLPEQRTARFVCVLALVGFEEEIVLEGECPGVILDAPRGEGGFGYDPIFYYPKMNKTFSEMTTEEKNRVSHRRRAIERLAEIIHPLLDGRMGSVKRER